MLVYRMRIAVIARAIKTKAAAALTAALGWMRSRKVAWALVSLLVVAAVVLGALMVTGFAHKATVAPAAAPTALHTTRPALPKTTPTPAPPPTTVPATKAPTTAPTTTAPASTPGASTEPTNPAGPNQIPAPSGPETVTVQPGQSLWLLAQQHLGSGLAWHTIYQLNASHISNPNLIYAGQVLQI